MALPACHTAAMMLRGWISQSRTELEPYEAGWAREAVAFVCIQEANDASARLLVGLESSPDGIRWAPLAPVQELPASGVHRLRADGLGNWLRATLVSTSEVCVDFYWVLK